MNGLLNMEPAERGGAAVLPAQSIKQIKASMSLLAGLKATGNHKGQGELDKGNSQDSH